ncbi:phage capsid protein [Delftia acidovorans]|uniref:recombination directionality factor n=1 Tax=Delftia acidovorans TaxID=80866 RepID=UPI0028968EB5|nr:phage capsid protein [Delftia acidovorans]
MIKGLMMTPPVVGRISIGKLVDRNGMRLPEKDDEFTITTQVQNRQGWLLHPLDGILRSQAVERVQMTSGVEVTELNEIPAEFADHFRMHEQVQRRQERGAQEIRSSGSVAKMSLRDKLSQRAQSKDKGPPADQEQRSDHEAAGSIAPVAARSKLRCIPVRLLFNDPALNLQANYTLFDRATSRPLCVGDGQTCKRVTDAGIKQLPCTGPDLCPLALEKGCKPFGRFHVRIDHPSSFVDALSTFVLRTTGINTLRTLLARMQYLQAVSGGLLAYLPLEMRLRGKSTSQSRRTPIYYVDLGVREPYSLASAIQEAVHAAEQARSCGYDQERLEQVARAGYALGLFEELEAEAVEIVKEFFPPSGSQAAGALNGLSTE